MTIHDIWNILEITPTNDIKVIKEVYSKKLKVTKPNEKPEEFKKLHYAYKLALEFSKHNELRSEKIIEAKNAIETKKISGEPSQLTDDPCSIDQSENDSKKSVERKRLSCLIEKTLNDSNFNDINKWNFLSHNQYLLNDILNWELSIWTFLKVAEKLQALSQANTKMDPAILNLLNTVFNWDQKEDHIRYILIPKLCDALFLELEKTERLIYHDSLRRLKVVSNQKKLSDAVSKEIESSAAIFFSVLIIIFFCATLQKFLLPPKSEKEDYKKQSSVNHQRDKSTSNFLLEDMLYKKKVIKLSSYGTSSFTTTIQADLITRNLEEYDRLVFDFSGVEYVSTQFLDRVFRVYADQHPYMIIERKNENYLIKRVH